MNIFDAFGGFKPNLDNDAAIKFALNALLSDGRLDELDSLSRYEIGGIEGEPGWIIERRSIEELGERPENPPWPEGAMFRAYVDPDAYELTHPEFFMSQETFEKYVSAGRETYRRLNPGLA